MNTKTSSKITEASQRAKRLLLLRDMAGLTRDALQKRYKIARGTLQNWESARFGGLTEKGARIMTQLYQAEGVHCSIDWLLHGIGPHPSCNKDHYQQSTSVLNATTASGNLTKEILYFRDNNTNAIDMVVNDDAMLPWYKPGDMIMGVRVFHEKMKTLLGKVCIVQTQQYGNLLRVLQSGSREGIFNLQATNIHRHGVPSCICDVEVISAAAIIWTRSTHFSL